MSVLVSFQVAAQEDQGATGNEDSYEDSYEVDYEEDPAPTPTPARKVKSNKAQKSGSLSSNKMGANETSMGNRARKQVERALPVEIKSIYKKNGVPLDVDTD